jgi:hypothetical protein
VAVVFGVEALDEGGVGVAGGEELLLEGEGFGGSGERKRRGREVEVYFRFFFDLVISRNNVCHLSKQRLLRCALSSPLPRTSTETP